MPHLALEELRLCADVIATGGLDARTLVGSIQQRAPALAGRALGAWELLTALNDAQPDPRLLLELLEDARVLLVTKGWAEGGPELAPFNRAREVLRRAQWVRDLDERIAEASKAWKKATLRREPTASDLEDQLERLRRERKQGPPIREGDILGGRYEISGPLGHGGFGTVWLALDLNDPGDDPVVAVKVLRGELQDDETLIACFDRGAVAMQRASHRVKGVVGVKQSVQQDGPYRYFVMEYVPGNNFGEELAEREPTRHDDEDDSARRARRVDVVIQTCATVADLHDFGMLHLDIKPTNVLVELGGRARLTDFEVYGSPDDPALTHQAKPHLSYLYTAPEVEQGQAPTRAADQFSLGRLALAALVGHPLNAGIVGQDLRRLPGLTVAEANVLWRACHPEPDARYPDVRTFQEALVHALDNTGLEAWLRAFELPRTIALGGLQGYQMIYAALCTLSSTEELKELLTSLDVDPYVLGDQMPLDQACDTVADWVVRRRNELEFWERLDRRIFATRVGAARFPNVSNSVFQRLESLLLKSISLDELGLFAALALPEGWLERLPPAQGSSLQRVSETLWLADEAGALPALLGALCEAHPYLRERFDRLGATVATSPTRNESLRRTWDAIPVVGVHDWLARSLPPSAQGLIAPAWPHSRARNEGALLLWRARVGAAGRAFTPPVATPAEHFDALLAVMFGPDELRLLGQRLDLERELPGPLASAAQFAQALARLVVHPATEGNPDPGLFRLLLTLRPRWEAEILACAAQFGLPSEACRTAALPGAAPLWQLGEALYQAWPDGVLPGDLFPPDVRGRLLPRMSPPRLRAHRAAAVLFQVGLLFEPHELLLRLGPEAAAALERLRSPALAS